MKLEKYTLENGLRLIFQKDESTTIAVVNTLYNVGSKDEDPEHTGFAHLFEHLMFGGSKNIDDFDGALQISGGENNAFTSNDITNYYISIPVQNIETAFWLESDRMLELDFSQRNLDIQRNVVIEEFKERYLNQPYGDVWIYLRKMAYENHPYSWPTIGKEISHIEKASLQEVRDFFYRYYAPDNAILVVIGNLEGEFVYSMVNKWFGNIEKRNVIRNPMPVLQEQLKQNRLRIEKDVPYHALYIVFKMCKKSDPDFYATDLLSDILSNGRSSRFYQNHLSKGELFSELDAYLSGELQEGLFVITATLLDGKTIESAEKAIMDELNHLINNGVSKQELRKVMNKLESTKVFSEINTTSRAYMIAMHELTGDANDINFEIEKYRQVKPEDILRVARKIFRPENSSVLEYLSKR
ncbi:MAG: pitrilysin family protein [Bacteroidales bacterium]